MKVKFTKLAALLLAGVALLAAGCTDYEVDIQKVDKKVDELAAKTAADLDAQVNALKAMISALEQSYKDADAALKQQIEAKIAELNAQIADLNNLKLDKSTFDAYKAETAQTLKLMQDALDDLAANCATKEELQAAVAEISAKFDDYVLQTTFDEFVAIAATKEELNAAKTKLEKDIADLQAKLEGDMADLEGKLEGEIEAAKAQMIAELDKLNKALEQVNAEIAALDERVTVLENAVADVMDELAFAEGDLQGYIDDGDAATLEEAIAYVDEYMEWLIDQLNDILDEIYDRLAMALQRIQSIQYVPDYDDMKITVNMAYVTQETEPDAQVMRAKDAEGEDMTAVMDQPTKVTYQFLPAQYAETIAEGIKENIEEKWTREEAKDYGYKGVVAFFNVKPVNTRAEDAEEEIEYGFEILDVLSADKTTGEITFLVMPQNIASAQFAANGLKPIKEVYMFDATYGNSVDYPLFTDGESDSIWFTRAWDSMVHYVYNLDDLKAFEARTAFAAQLRMYRLQDYDINWDALEEEEIDWDNLYIDYENELASPYNVLYPDVTEITILPDPYKPELDEDGNVVTDEEGNTVLVKAVPEYQYLPYSSLRENPVGEKEDQDPKGYRIILDQAVPGIEIDGNVYTVEDAAKKGFILPPIETVFDEFTYDQGSADELDEENFVETAQVYAEIEMNPAKSAAERKLAVGNIITGWYAFETAMGKTPFYGEVEITKPLGEVKLTAEIKWEYSQDADTDHDVYYNDADPLYTHVEVPVAINADDAKALEDNLAVTLDDFAGLEPTKLTITYVDAETGETVEAADVKIENVKIEDGELFADFVDFEWDQTYTVEAEYELEAALITVKATVTTIDRNRDLIVVNVPEYAFVLNGQDYDAETDTYTSEDQEIQKDLFDAFVKQLIINQLDPKDFEDEEAFIGKDNNGKEGHLEVVPEDKLEEGEANSEYVQVDDDFVTLIATSPELKAILEAGEDQTIFVTSYIGQKIEIIWPVTVDLPGYDFLHLSYYTFNSEKENGTFIQKRDFADNDGSVIWWTQVNPSYFTTVKSENETEDEAQANRVSNRYALADYDVAYINLAELAFNVVDEKDNILEDADIEEANLVVEFVYTDPKQGDKDLPKVDQIDPDFMIYQSLWVDNTVFYYRTNEKKFVPALGTLGILSGETVFELPTRFDTPKASVKYPDEMLDYSTYAMVRWTPFQEPKAEGYTIVLDENQIYSVPLFKGMELKDNRPNGVSFYVIEDGEWVIGDAAENATAASKTNGYIEGIAANEAYHINTTFTYDDLELPAELRKLLSVKFSADGEEFVDEQDEEGTLTPYIVFDYTSEVQFHGVVTIPVVVALENPWQETLKFKYNIVIKGYGD